jgi:SAM-dependent methyltransferase
MSFDVPADAYDRFMGRFSAPLATVFLDWVDLGDARTALDVGCGPGALTAQLEERLGATSVAAVDPSPSFIAAARERHPGVDVREAVAEDLPFADDAFDACLAQLVVHFMTDPIAGLREMRRVTAPGGVVAACVWDFAGARAPQSRFFEALRAATGRADDESDRAGAAAGALGALLEEAGCTDVAEEQIHVVQAFDGFDEWWEPYTLAVAPAGRQLAALDEATRERVRQTARDLFPDGPFTVGATAWAARGGA